MSSPPVKTPSPHELAKLEHAFASDPGSDAYRPLAEAYLGMGRFMEAMVVCKKGVKAHPTRPDPRMLLARVYAQQGKDKKALEELQSALAVSPTDRGLLRMIGGLQLKTGDAAAGKTTLLKVHALEPGDPETAAAFAQWKVEVPKPPPPPEPVAAPPMLMPSSTPFRAGPGAVPRFDPARPGAPAQRPRGTNGTAAHAQGYAAHEPRVHEDEEHVHATSTARAAGSRRLFVLAVPVAALVVIGYFAFGQYSAKRQNLFKRNIKEASEQLKHDSFASYKKASTAAEAALEVEPSSVAAHAYLGYAYAIRWGEHGDGDDARRFAEDHLAAAKRGGELDSHIYAADALLKAYSGKPSKALGELQSQVKAFDEQGRASALLYHTLGLIQMNGGDLEHARESLERAQSLAPSDPRIYAALGALNRRRGDARAADQSYTFALKFERDHPDSLLGRGLLSLEQDNPAALPFAASNLRKLLDADPPPSARQLATAHLARALLIARVQAVLPQLRGDDARRLSDATGVTTDRPAAMSQAAKEDDQGFALDRNNPELHLLRGKRLLVDGQVDAAIREMRDAVKTDPTRAQFYVELARGLMLKPEGARDAQDALTTAIRTMGESPRLMVLLGQAYRKQGKLDEAAAQFTKAVADPRAKNPDARLQLGELYRERKDYPRSEEQLSRAAQEFIGQSSRIAETYTELARTFEAEDQRPRADETYQRALNADPGFPDAYFFYAKFLASERRNREKARTTAAEYMRLDPKGDHASEAQALAR